MGVKVDCRYQALLDHGIAPRALPEMMFEWYGLQGGVGNTNLDRQHSMLIAQGAKPAHYKDMWYELLIAGGHDSEGRHINDMMTVFWCAGGTFGLPVSTDFHWDADALDTLWNDPAKTIPHTGVDNVRVGAWAVESGVANVGTDLISVGTDRPKYLNNILNGLPIIRFDPADINNYLDSRNATGLFNTTDLTLMAVLKLNSELDSVGIFGAAENGDPPYREGTGFSFSTGTAANIDKVTANRKFSNLEVGSDFGLLGGFFLYEWHIDTSGPNLSELYIDGTLQVDDDTSFDTDVMNPDYMRMAASGDFLAGFPTDFNDMDMAELALYPFALTDTQRNTMRNYFQKKWLPTSPFVFIP